MPTPLPSSFASAAAGNTQDASSRRGDGTAGGEWYATQHCFLVLSPWLQSAIYLSSFRPFLPANCFFFFFELGHALV